MKRKLIVGGLLVVLVAPALYFALLRPKPAEGSFRSGVFEPPREAPNFTLDGSNGMKVSLRDYHGKVVVLEFGFTFCQQVCPVTLAHLTEVFTKLGPAASDVQVLYVTVDPKRDSPARLNEYLSAFNPSFLGATGTTSELEGVRQAYGIIANEVISENKQLGYEVSHSSFIYLIDRLGKIRTLVPFGTAADDIVHDINLLLKT